VRFAPRDFSRRRPELGVEVISTLNGHVIALYLDDRIPPRLSAERTNALIHEQGGLAVAVHPYHPLRYRRVGCPPISALLPDLPFDAIEVVNNSGALARVYDAWAALRNAQWMLPVTAGSDAHDVWYVGSAVTRFDGHSAADLRVALVTGRTRAHLAWSWSPASFPGTSLSRVADPFPAMGETELADPDGAQPQTGRGRAVWSPRPSRTALAARQRH
jgi:hypothetical protein